MATVLEKTSKEDQELALSAISQLRVAVSDINNVGFTEIKMQEQQQPLRIPAKAFQLLVDIVGNMAEGKSVVLIPSETTVSTQQAAELLNVSRPHIIKLLESDVIPHIRVGTHRRIEWKDLMEYEKNLKNNRKQKLDFLAEQAQELNLGY